MDYELLRKQVSAICSRYPYKVANLANVSALLNEVLDNINWVGFYLMENGKLVLGPFQGLVACVEIQVGKGVCGTCVSTKETQLVPNVHEFPGHIACDSRSNSEIVIPLFNDGEVVGVLDIDSEEFNRFSLEDKVGLEAVAGEIEKNIFGK